jgi:uncharacterized protein
MKGSALFYRLRCYGTALLLLLGAALGPAGAGAAAEAGRQTVIIGRNQVYQTRYYVFDSGVPGPVVLVEAGIHGDEVAGVYALEEMVPRIRVSTGKLILFPRMNPPALEINRRYYNVDLNRVFPGLPAGPLYEYQLAWEIYHMLQKERVEYALTLHESRNLHNPSRPKTFGQTIVYGVESPPRVLWGWLQEVNRKLPDDEKFCDYYCPQEYGATDIMVRQLRIKGGFAVETWRALDLLRRIELQKLVVLTFLKQVGLEFTVK